MAGGQEEGEAGGGQGGEERGGGGQEGSREGRGERGYPGGKNHTMGAMEKPQSILRMNLFVS